MATQPQPTITVTTEQRRHNLHRIEDLLRYHPAFTDEFVATMLAELDKLAARHNGKADTKGTSSTTRPEVSGRDSLT